jgi:glycosyltransferase involved in cell wall biosynthesis
VIAEAMASQRPVVVSRAGGASELISEEEDALAFSPCDHAGLAQQMMRLAKDPGLRTRLAIRARRAALDRFDRRHTAAEIIRIYESLARPHGALPIQSVLMK